MKFGTSIEFIHQYLQDRIFDVKMSLFFYPMSAFILYGTFTLPFELQAYKIALTFFALIMAVLPITHYFKTIRTFKEAQRIETVLI